MGSPTVPQAFTCTAVFCLPSLHLRQSAAVKPALYLALACLLHSTKSRNCESYIFYRVCYATRTTCAASTTGRSQQTYNTVPALVVEPSLLARSGVQADVPLQRHAVFTVWAALQLIGKSPNPSCFCLHNLGCTDMVMSYATSVSTLLVYYLLVFHISCVTLSSSMCCLHKCSLGDVTG